MKYKIGQKVKLNMGALLYYAEDNDYSNFYNYIEKFEDLILEIIGCENKKPNIANHIMEYQYKVVLTRNGEELINLLFESELKPYIQQLELF